VTRRWWSFDLNAWEMLWGGRFLGGDLASSSPHPPSFNLGPFRRNGLLEMGVQVIDENEEDEVEHWDVTRQIIIPRGEEGAEPWKISFRIRIGPFNQDGGRGGG